MYIRHFLHLCAPCVIKTKKIMSWRELDAGGGEQHSIGDSDDDEQPMMNEIGCFPLHKQGSSTLSVSAARPPSTVVSAASHGPQDQGLRGPILHLDVDNFYVSVHRLRKPSLRPPTPVVVHQTNSGGIVALSDEAKALGIKKGEGIGAIGNVALERFARTMPQLRKEFPQVVFIEMETGLYRTHRQAIVDYLKTYFTAPGDKVQNVSYDDNYVQLGRHCTVSEAAAVAETLRTAVIQDLGLPITLGVATNKLAAKLIGASGKPSRGGSGVAVAQPGEEVGLFLSSPLRAVVGKEAAVAMAPAATLAEVDLGALEPRLRVLCEPLKRGMHEEEVIDSGPAASVSCQRAFTPRDGPDPVLLRTLCETLIERVAETGRRPLKLTAYRFNREAPPGSTSASTSRTSDWRAGAGADWVYDCASAFFGSARCSKIGVKAAFAAKGQAEMPVGVRPLTAQSFASRSKKPGKRTIDDNEEERSLELARRLQKEEEMAARASKRRKGAGDIRAFLSPKK